MSLYLSLGSYLVSYYYYSLIIIIFSFFFFVFNTKTVCIRKDMKEREMCGVNLDNYYYYECMHV